jgi:hypothetical protein
MKRHLLRYCVFALSVIGLESCTPENPTIDVVPISDVLTSLKQQIGSLQLTSQIPADQAGQCSSAGGTITVIASPIKAAVELKTVVTGTQGVTAGATIPVGTSGVIVSPSVGASASEIGTTDITLDLGFQHTPPTLTDIQTSVTNLQSYLKTNQTVLTDLQKDPVTNATVIKMAKKNVAAAQILLTQNEQALVATEYPPVQNGVSPFQAPGAVVPLNAATVMRSSNLNIEKAFSSAIQGILLTSHTPPCFLPKDLVIKANFELVKNANGGVTVQFLIVKLGSTASIANDNTQSITVTFDLSQGSAAAAGPAGN